MYCSCLYVNNGSHLRNAVVLIDVHLFMMECLLNFGETNFVVFKKLEIIKFTTLKKGTVWKL